MTANELLQSEDAEFLCWLQLWADNREPPVPFIDWLLDRDMHRAVSAVRWVFAKGYRKCYKSCSSGFKSKESLTFPYRYPKEHPKSTLWSWVGNNNTDYGGADQLEWSSVGYVNFPDVRECLCWLLDNYPEKT